MSGNPLDDFSKQAIRVFGSEASTELFRRLKEDRSLCATRCDGCGEIAFPPRMHCPACFGAQISWVPIGEGATLYAFTTQSRGLRFTAPDVIGIVEIPDVGLVFAPIAGTRSELEIGQPLSVEIIEINDSISFYRFVPA